MERETIKVKTPITQKEVILQKWITAGEAEYIQEPIFGSLKLDLANQTPQTSFEGNNNIQMLKEVTKRTIETYVLKIDECEDKEEINKILKTEMPESDYNFVMEEIKNLKEPEQEKKKV